MNTAVVEDASITKISDWIIESALAGIDSDRLVRDFCEKLNEANIPVVRAQVASGFLHPMFRSFSVTWSKSMGVTRSRFPHAKEKTDEWLNSPFKALFDRNENHLRCRIWMKEGLNQFPILRELQEQGYTDYLAKAVPFTDNAEKSWSRMDGTLTSWSTDEPAGFSDSQLSALHRLVQRLALGLKMFVREVTTHNVISTYLGSHAGERVLNGQF